MDSQPRYLQVITGDEIWTRGWVVKIRKIHITDKRILGNLKEKYEETFTRIKGKRKC